ncbi:uncharacterized protein LOC129940319 [Eupeodes corollae]|uniref:uncharacterized protein LOC129940319 n=1 Tax=Eupeodes corollae TaxID=290404 RepID=UPI0024929949|nr:uncharacterized protein LOC129940319 [Eupeodes corollae]
MKRHFVALLIALSVTSDSGATCESFSKKFGHLEITPQESQNTLQNSHTSSVLLFQENSDNSDRGLILNSEGKKALKNLIHHLPCGFPQYGIPPLAPYTQEEVTINFKTNFFQTFSKLFRFRVDGLNHMLINKFKISYTFGKKVKYSLTIPKIVLTGKIVSDIYVDLMEEYGVKIRYDGEGNFEMILKDIIIDGSFKYKAPLIFGSIKIYDFTMIISLGKVISQIKFTDTLEKFNEFLNYKIEDYLWKIVNYNKNRISVLIEENVVPVVNEKMKGHKIWYLIGLLSEINGVCYPPPVPWE